VDVGEATTPTRLDRATETDVRIRRLSAEFVDPDVEASFREANVDADARRLRTVLAFGAVIAPIFSIPDFIHQGATTTNLAILGTQSAVAAVALWVLLRTYRRPESVLADRPITAVATLAMVSALVSLSLRPAQTTFVQVTFCILAAAIFMIVPIRYVAGLIVTTVGLAGIVTISLVLAPPERRSDFKVVMGLVSLVVVCGWAGNSLARNRRVGHANLLHERWSNERLTDEIARREVLEGELTWLADHDTLTNVLNRRAFIDQAGRLMDRARRTGEKVSVLMIDADLFKTINDDFGHHVGDEAIRAIAKLCTLNVRSGDLVGRLGGEEFAVVMPTVDLRVAEQVAARLCEQVALHRIEHPNGPVSFTISIGVTECSLTPGDTIHDALRRADRAMYKAKAAGRNRVIATTGRPQSPVAAT
jgi:diguanylate cyclase (GGDEF)-like protein